MDFSTVVILLIVAGGAWILYKAFSKKESVVDAVKEEIAEVKAEVVKVEVVAKTAATKAKNTVKKATTRKPKAPAKK